MTIHFCLLVCELMDGYILLKEEARIWCIVDIFIKQLWLIFYGHFSKRESKTINFLEFFPEKCFYSCWYVVNFRRPKPCISGSLFCSLRCNGVKKKKKSPRKLKIWETAALEWRYM